MGYSRLLPARLILHLSSSGGGLLDETSLTRIEPRTFSFKYPSLLHVRLQPRSSPSSADIQLTKRGQDRIKGVLPVTISGIDAAGSRFHEIAHTLDITSNGARLGAIHRRLRTQDLVILQHRHRKVEFRVVWIKSLEDRGEYQVGLQMVVPGNAWRV